MMVRSSSVFVKLSVTGYHYSALLSIFFASVLTDPKIMTEYAQLLNIVTNSKAQLKTLQYYDNNATSNSYK